MVPVTDPSAPADPEVRHLRAQAAGYARRGNAAASAEASRQLRLVQLEKHIKRIVDGAPPLTDEQRARLALLLHPGTGGGADG